VSCWMDCCEVCKVTSKGYKLFGLRGSRLGVRFVIVVLQPQNRIPARQTRAVFLKLMLGKGINPARVVKPFCPTIAPRQAYALVLNPMEIMRTKICRLHFSFDWNDDLAAGEVDGLNLKQILRFNHSETGRHLRGAGAFPPDCEVRQRLSASEKSQKGYSFPSRS
jgi:hypothetical protein